MSQSTKRTVLKRILRLAALIIASISALTWVFFIVMQVVVGLQKGQDVLTPEGGLVAILVLVNAAGAILGWWKTTSGIRILLVGGLALSIVLIGAAGRTRALVVAVSGLPFLLSGSLLWLSTRLGPDPEPSG